MTDTMRVEPTLGSAPASADSPAVAELRAAVDAAPADTTPRLDRAGLDQLSRIEEKTARIEEKYARSEALLQRYGDKIEAATGRMGEVALQADLVAVREEVGALARRFGRLPGFGALMLTAVVTAILTAAVTVALIKYVPGLLAR